MANINGKIQTDVIILDDTYDVSVAIPTSTPVVGVNPYTLTIYNEAEVALTPATENVAMLAHVAASYNVDSKETFPDNFYLELSPPASILPNIKDSTDPTKTTFAIKNIAIQFATGAYVDAKEIPGSVKGTKA
ncbi:hypothetical protein [Flavobacterium sp.]|uniref:hypothetical protein n=1 Tax=Flavobacterium sp. TaxID=239 RepID=UPI003D09E7A0